MVITGYVKSGNTYLYLIQDPEPTNGVFEFYSYVKLINGRNTVSGEIPDTGVWECAITVDTDYSQNTIPYYFG